MPRVLGNFTGKDSPVYHWASEGKEENRKKTVYVPPVGGWIQPMFNQSDVDTVFKVLLRRLLRDGAERVHAFSSATMRNLTLKRNQ